MGRVCVLVLLLAVIAPPAWAADERQLSTDAARTIRAEGGWRTWESDGRAVWWQAGGVVRTDSVFGPLGSDARGRPIVVLESCGRERCVFAERQLASGVDRLLLRTPFADAGADEHRGTVGVVRAPISRHGRVRVRKRGERRLRVVDRSTGFGLDIGNGFLVYVAYAISSDYRVRVVDFRQRRARARTVAINSSQDEDCRCTMTASSIAGVALEGRYAYWLLREFRARNGHDLWVGDNDVRTRLFRVNVRAESPQVQTFSPAQLVGSFAVDRGVLIYAGDRDRGSPGVWEVARPDWESTRYVLPVCC